MSFLSKEKFRKSSCMSHMIYKSSSSSNDLARHSVLTLYSFKSLYLTYLNHLDVYNHPTTL